MTAYRRPPIGNPTFVGPDGTSFEYGNRWGFDGPPEDTYSVDSHPERFAPVHGVATALVEHLVATYDVAVDEGEAVLADFRREPPRPVTRALRLRSASDEASDLAVAWDTYPGILLHAGVLLDAYLPMCGCDACDETAESMADELEGLVFAVAEGRFREWVDPERRIVGHETTGPTRTGESWGFREDLSDAQLRAAADRLRSLSDGWRPWPRRTAAVP